MINSIYSVIVALLVIGAGNVTNQETPVEPPQTSMFSGIIEDLHTGARTLDVKAVLLTKTFAVAPDCEIVAPDRPKGDFADLKVGEEVNVTYQAQGGGTLIAHRIEQKGTSPTATSAPAISSVAIRR